jgi:protein ImuA
MIFRRKCRVRAPLATLRERIRQIEQPRSHGVLPFGIAAIDRALPGGGLALGAVHEILGQGGDEEDGAAACGFIAGILARIRPGPVLWCLKRPDLYGPGLLARGLDPARLIVVSAPRDEDILWAVEEGLRAPGLIAVVGEIGRLPLVAGRRLQLAAEHSGVTAFLLRRWRNSEEAARERERPSAAVTRWRIAALPARDIDDPRLRHLIGQPRWRVELLRCRGGVPAEWIVEVADATGHVRLSPELADRPAAAQQFDTEPRLRHFG